MAPFYGWSSTALMLDPLRRQFTFYHLVPRNSWHSLYRPRKDERLSRPWSHPVVLNLGPLYWELSTLTTRPLLHKPASPQYWVFYGKQWKFLWRKKISYWTRFFCLSCYFFTQKLWKTWWKILLIDDRLNIRELAYFHFPASFNIRFHSY